MEFLIVIFFVVYSIWAEINKKKQEDVDIDFSELSSLDDFFKQDSTGLDKQRPKKRPSARSYEGRVAEPVLASRRQENRSKTVSASDILSTMSGSGNFADESHKTLPPRVNYDRDPVFSARSTQSQETTEVLDSGVTSANVPFGRFTIGPDDLAKSIIFAEVLQRYDMARIYSRIPEFKDED